MHELGVVFYVIKDVNEVAKENDAEKVTKVTLQIGEVSGIIHDYLIDCWNWAKKKEPLLNECDMKIEPIKAITYCEQCGKKFETVKYGKKCPYCNSFDTWLYEGNEFLIKDIEIY